MNLHVKNCWNQKAAHKDDVGKKAFYSILWSFNYVKYLLVYKWCDVNDS